MAKKQVLRKVVGGFLSRASRGAQSATRRARVGRNSARQKFEKRGGGSVKKFWIICRWLYIKFCDTKGCADIHIKKVQPGGKHMKKQEPIKVINVVQNKDKAALQKLITEKISRIISAEYNNS
jgi:hypothetical protein